MITDKDSMTLIKDVKLLNEGYLSKVDNQEIDGYIKTENGRYYIAFIFDKFNSPSPKCKCESYGEFMLSLSVK